MGAHGVGRLRGLCGRLGVQAVPHEVGDKAHAGKHGAHGQSRATGLASRLVLEQRTQHQVGSGAEKQRRAEVEGHEGVQARTRLCREHSPAGHGGHQQDRDDDGRDAAPTGNASVLSAARHHEHRNADNHEKHHTVQGKRDARREVGKTTEQTLGASQAQGEQRDSS